MAVNILDYENPGGNTDWSQVLEDISDQITLGNLSNPILIPSRRGDYYFNRTVIPSGQIIIQGAGTQHTNLYFPPGMDGFLLKWKGQFAYDHSNRPDSGNAGDSQFLDFSIYSDPQIPNGDFTPVSPLGFEQYQVDTYINNAGDEVPRLIFDNVPSRGSGFVIRAGGLVKIKNVIIYYFQGFGIDCSGMTTRSDLYPIDSYWHGGADLCKFDSVRVYNTGLNGFHFQGAESGANLCLMCDARYCGWRGVEVLRAGEIIKLQSGFFDGANIPNHFAWCHAYKNLEWDYYRPEYSAYGAGTWIGNYSEGKPGAKPNKTVTVISGTGETYRGTKRNGISDYKGGTIIGPNSYLPRITLDNMLIQPLLDKSAFIIRDFNYPDTKRLDVFKFETRANEAPGWTIRPYGIGQVRTMTIADPERDESGNFTHFGGFGINSLANTQTVQNFVISTNLDANQSKDLEVEPQYPIAPNYTYSLEVVPIREEAASEFTITNWWMNKGRNRINVSLRNNNTQREIEAKIYISIKRYTANMEITI